MRVVFLILFLSFSVACSHAPPMNFSQQKLLFSPAMGKEMAYAVYTPPGWSQRESLPLVVLLHGRSDNHQTFRQYRINEYLDELINSGKLPRVIIVKPDGEQGFWENWADGSKYYRDWVMKDLLPVVTSEYSTLACPEHCHVSGISMGAHGALRFAYYENETFSSVASISGLILNKEDARKNTFMAFIQRLFIPVERIWGSVDDEKPSALDPYVGWINNQDMANLRLYLTWGKDDYGFIQSSNQRFQQHLEEHNRAHRWHIFDGKHRWTDWREPIVESIRFHLQGEARYSLVSN